MPRHFAFLRGINVGGHRVKMDRLREIFEELGFEQVETFIASGNVIFSSPSNDARALERRIADHLHAALGYEVPTFIRSPSELEAVASLRPSESGPTDLSIYVIFLAEAAGADVQEALRSLSTDTDKFEFAGREAFWLIDGKLSESPLFGVDLTRATGTAYITMRSITTVRRLASKFLGRD